MKKITVLAFDYVVASTVTGPFDVFHQAGVLWNYLCATEPTPFFDVAIVSADGRPFKCLGGINIAPHQSMDEVKSTDLIIISSISNIEKTLRKHPESIDWLKKHHERGSKIASICTGAFLLAETGLLNGKTATTHWGFARLFNERYPQVNLKPKRLITDEGDLFCSGGMNSGTDLCLYLVDKFFGHEIAVQCSKVMVNDYIRSNQEPYVINQFNKRHSDEKILVVQKYIENNHQERIDYDQLSEKFGLSRRTLERRFKAATGDTPLLYLQRFRIEVAKNLLEAQQYSVNEISYKIGYEDSGFFRKVFIQHTGLRPKEYQQKFTIDQ